MRDGYTHSEVIGGQRYRRFADLDPETRLKVVEKLSGLAAIVAGPAPSPTWRQYRQRYAGAYNRLMEYIAGVTP